ncbi:MAG TPA: branched-chain amino acid ABC transporter permease [Pyrinomonadaceae bacterium]|nr:branched-chain amino acid ABC transporter permease [Pyrinomonadaceae bacterium]
MFTQLFVNGIIAGSIYALVALGFSLIYNTTRFFHFAHAAVYTGGVYLAYFFRKEMALPSLVAYTLACAAAALVGMIIEIIVYRPMRKKGSDGLSLLIASLGVYIILENVISLIWGSETKTLREADIVEGISLLGARITPTQIIIIIVSFALVVLVSLVIWKSKAGVTLRAVSNDPELALVSGIESEKVNLLSFGIGSALAAAASILISFETNITPTMGFPVLVLAVIAIVVGGIGSNLGAILGGLLIGLAENLGVWKLPSKWQDTIAFMILIIFLFFRPQGFLGRRLKRVTVQV